MRQHSPKQEARRHRKVVALLLVLGTVMAFVATFSFWVSRQALNTDNWVNASSKLLENKQIQTQVSTFLVNQLYANVNVEAELRKALPAQAKALAGPAAGGLRQLAQQVAERALATPQVQGLWADANRAAHEQLLKVIDGGGPVVSTGEGEVTLHLDALVKQVGDQVGLPGDLASKLPPQAGTLTVLSSEQLSTTQKVAQAIRHLPVVLTALLILLYGAAVYLARGWRREAVRGVGLGFVLAGVLALLVRNLAGSNIVDSLASTASVKPAVEAAWDIGTSLLVTVAVSAIAFGVLTVIGAWLAGPTAPAVALRREAAPHFRDRRGTSYAVAGAIWLALIAWAPIAAFSKPFGIVLFAILFAIGTEVLRRQALREFPEAQATSVADRLRAIQRTFGRPRADGAASPGNGSGFPGGSAQQLDQLERLASLRREGVLTEDEFESQKRQLLKST